MNVDQARALLRYEPETGKLFWRTRPRAMCLTERDWKAWNTRFSGREALTTIDGKGYLGGRVFDRMRLAHRVAWLIQTGEWPADQIDHINGDRTDNRWRNLRAVTRADNARNQKLHSNNTSGICGVSWVDRDRKWVAHIKVDGRSRHLGYFDSAEAAGIARKAAEKRHGFSPRHGEMKL